MSKPGDRGSAPGFAGTEETAQAPVESQPPLVLGDRYELLEELGRGAAGRVYRAFDRFAGETVAVKVLAYAAADETMDRLRRELRAARRVTHPGVVRLHDLMTFQGAPALTMELVEGETLQALLVRERRLEGRRLVTLLNDLALAVAAAHRAGVVHRDLKPANIILRKANGRAVITDFGISRIAPERGASAPPRAPDDASTTLTEEGLLVGTPLYMAPEQLAPGGEVGPTADVYALGLVAWEAATGRALDRDLSLNELVRTRTMPRTLDLRDARPDLPQPLCDVIARCLRYEPAERFASANELREALDTIADRATGATRARRLALPAAAIAIAAGAVGLSLRSRGGVADPRPPVASSPVSSAPPPTWSPRIRQLSTREQNLDRPALSPDGRTIVVPSSRAGHWDLWQLDPERDEWRALTDDAAFDAAPQFVEEGRALVFYSERAGKRGLHRLALDKGAAPEFLEPAVFVHIGATRDGRRVFFSREERDLYSYDLATRTATKLTTLDDGLRVLGISSDERGDQVVLSVQRHPTDAKQSPESTNDLFVFRVDEQRGELVTHDGKWHGTAAFVPGAPGVLVSSSRRGGLLNLWKLHTDGGEPTQLAVGSGDDIFALPTWDGRALLYVHDQTIRQIFARAPRASAWTRITHEAIDHVEPKLDATGRHLVFTTFDRDRNTRTAWEADAPTFDPPRAMSLPIDPIVIRPLPGTGRYVVLAAGAGQNELVLIDRTSGAPVVVASKLTTTSVFSVSADGARIAFVDGDAGRIVSLADAGASPTPFAAVRAIDFSPRRSNEIALVRITSPGAAIVEVRDLTTGSTRATAKCADSDRIVWSRDGASIWIVPSLEPTLRRVDARDGHTLETVAAPGDNTLSLTVADDGTLVAESAVGQSRLMWMENFGAAP